MKSHPIRQILGENFFMCFGKSLPDGIRISKPQYFVIDFYLDAIIKYLT